MSNIKKLLIVTCDDHGQEVVIHNGEIIYQDDCGTEVLNRVADILDLEIEYENISGEEYEERYA